MQDSTLHLLNSVSKSFVGMLAGIAVEDGLLDTDKYVCAYLPELADTAFRETTVQHALDMTAAVAYSEDYDKTTDDFGTKPPWSVGGLICERIHHRDLH